MKVFLIIKTKMNNNNKKKCIKIGEHLAIHCTDQSQVCAAHSPFAHTECYMHA